MGKIENLNGGWGEIRTHGGRKPSTVFKTVAFNRSATHPKKKCGFVKNQLFSKWRIG